MVADENCSILIVGPEPRKGIFGGVVQHMRFLQSLNALRGAEIFDPGSIHGRLGLSTAIVIKNCFELRRKLSSGHFRQIWINSSIYQPAFLKLLLILFVIRKAPEIKIRVFFHGGRFEEIRFLQNNFLQSNVARALSTIDSLHFLSKEQGEGFTEHFPSLQWHQFNNYVPDISPVDKVKDRDKTVFMFVGRIVRTKGVFDLVAALKKLDAPYLKRLAVWFAGDGEDMWDLQKETTPSLPITFLGPVDHEAVAGLYARASVLVLPSYQEGFPYVILEGMRAGLPIIATPVGAIGDLIENDNNGFIVPRKSPIKLAGAMRRIIDDPALATEMGERNRELFLKSFSKVAAETYYGRLALG